MNRRQAIPVGMAAVAVGYMLVSSGALAQAGLALMGKSESGYSESVRSTNGRLQVLPVAADGGMAEVLVAAPDGGMPVSLPAGESAADPLYAAPVTGGAAVGAANPMPVGVVGAAQGATAAASATVTGLGADHSGVDVVCRDGSGAVIGTAGAPAYVRGSVDDGEAHDAKSVAVGGVGSDSVKRPFLLDADRRTVIALGANAGTCLGADLTTSSGNGPTLAAGTEYRVCALTDLWIDWDGGAAAADAPSEPLFARSCVIRGPFDAETTPTAILPSGASVLSGKEIVACPVAR